MKRLITIVTIALAVFAVAKAASAHTLPCVDWQDSVTCMAEVGPHDGFATTVTFEHNATCQALIGLHALDVTTNHTHVLGPNHVVYQQAGVRVDLRQTGWRRFHIHIRAAHQRVVTIILGSLKVTPF
jgi:hypothetical protein